MLRIARCHRKMDMPGSAREWFDRALGAARDPALKKEIQNER